jgi:hypothetical protein
MTIDAIITMMVIPYTINIETKEQELERLHQNMSLSTEPIITLKTLKRNFNTDNYPIKIYKWEEPSLTGTTLDGQELPPHVKAVMKNIRDIAMLKEGKQYIELTKQDIKELFSIELYREQQLNKILDYK